ncbi:hypothetical protein [Parerythrobacter jejuensis]|uniref:Uncharacterized protein n=1 Tax=Parerythrobacter jejuensis TaxID=795812 RepID=A0A845AVT0_9SPHN|nr:hypothetical protein [Parerythrobacter jejuensis]MXP30523.1 hypothetical protein [Parerythrobacter jejuensis]MXP33283.1 hypothetical protein [Parerythrobacter jejuensis]
MIDIFFGYVTGLIENFQRLGPLDQVIAICTVFGVSLASFGFGRRGSRRKLADAELRIAELNAEVDRLHRDASMAEKKHKEELQMVSPEAWLLEGKAAHEKGELQAAADIWEAGVERSSAPIGEALKLLAEHSISIGIREHCRADVEDAKRLSIAAKALSPADKSATALLDDIAGLLQDWTNEDPTSKLMLSSNSGKASPDQQVEGLIQAARKLASKGEFPAVSSIMIRADLLCQLHGLESTEPHLTTLFYLAQSYLFSKKNALAKIVIDRAHQKRATVSGRLAKDTLATNHLRLQILLANGLIATAKKSTGPIQRDFAAVYGPNHEETLLTKFLIAQIDYAAGVERDYEELCNEWIKQLASRGSTGKYIVADFLNSFIFDRGEQQQAMANQSAMMDEIRERYGADSHLYQMRESGFLGMQTKAASS